MKKVQVGRILKKYWQMTKGYKWFMFLALFAVSMANAIQVVIPLYYKDFFDVLASSVGTSKQTEVDSLISTLISIILLNIGAWVCYRTLMATCIYYESRCMSDLSERSLQYLHRNSYQFFSNSFTGTLVRRVNKFTRSFETLMDNLQFSFLPLFVTIAGNVIVLWTRHHLLAYVLIGWTVIFLTLNITYARWKTKYDFKKTKIDSDATGILADSLTNAMNVKLFAAHSHEHRRHKGVLDRLHIARMTSWGLGEFIETIQSALMIGIEFVLMYFAIQFWKEGLLTVGDFALIQSYLIAIFMKLWEFGRSIRWAFEALADADEMVEIFETPHDVVDKDDGQKIQIDEGQIVFNNVHFGFQDDRHVLRGMNLSIASGEKVAFVGPSGAGKTTITKLLFRFFDVNKGRILIDGQDICSATQDSLRGQISLVPQDPILFHRSIMDNIRYGRRDATDEEVIAAAKKARCHQFIVDYPQGYETFVGERGVKLSGGERQRVAIARAILKNAPILVLDEATSSLDSESEHLIQQALDSLMKNRTTIVVAHRLSTIMKMDRIVVLDQGRIVDSGTHTQLLGNNGGIYKKLWDIQSGGYTYSHTA